MFVVVGLYAPFRSGLDMNLALSRVWNHVGCVYKCCCMYWLAAHSASSSVVVALSLLRFLLRHGVQDRFGPALPHGGGRRQCWDPGQNLQWGWYLVELCGTWWNHCRCTRSLEADGLGCWGESSYAQRSGSSCGSVGKCKITALLSSEAKARCQCKRPNTLGSDHRICRNACRSRLVAGLFAWQRGPQQEPGCFQAWATGRWGACARGLERSNIFRRFGRGSIQRAVADPASTCLRIRPGKSTTTPPANPEELRLRHRRLGLAWAFVKPRHANRSWIPESSLEDFRKYSDFILGATVAGLRSADGNGPSWALVLTYELEVRKTAYRYVRDAICNDMACALEKACVAPALNGFHFVTPLQLGKREQMWKSGVAQGAPRAKGSGKGKGKWDRQWGKSATTADGRKKYFNFNKAGSCQKKHCDFAHACQHCFGKHSLQHRKFKWGAKYPAAAESWLAVAPAAPSPAGGECQSHSGESACEDWRSAGDGEFVEEAEYKTGGDGIHLKGARGRGPLMHGFFNGKRKAFTDGFGLCSPGRWPPEARQDFYENPDLAFHHRLGTLLLDLLTEHVDVRGVAFLLASGKCASCPFSDEPLQRGREIVLSCGRRSALLLMCFRGDSSAGRRSRCSCIS